MTMGEVMNIWWSTHQAAQYAGVSPRTVNRWYGSGLEFRQIGRIKRTRLDWVDAFLMAQLPQSLEHAARLRGKEKFLRDIGEL